MRKVFLFMMISLDGYFEGKDHDISWHNVDEEFVNFAIEQTESVGTLLFGRRTYQLMEGFWPTEEARVSDPKTAELMNNTPKIVFSKTLEKVEETENWKNITLVKDHVEEEIKKLKEQPGKDIAVYGSSNLCVSLLKMGLLDELRIIINPVAIDEGTTLFEGLDQKLKLNLEKTRQFKNGNVLLCYQVLK